MCMICGLRYCPVTCPGYDEAEDPWVTGYCEECGKEILRIHVTDGMPTHQFQNEICTVCGEEQRERN